MPSRRCCPLSRPHPCRYYPSLTSAIPTILIGRDAGFAMFNVPYDNAACVDANAQLAPIAIGTVGDPIQQVASQFDGWGYVHAGRPALTTSNCGKGVAADRDRSCEVERSGRL